MSATGLSGRTGLTGEGLRNSRWPGREPSAIVMTCLVVTYVALLPVQVEIDVLRSRLAPSDLVLVPAVVLVGGRLLAGLRLLSIWHGLLLMLIGAGAGLTLWMTGVLSTWALLNKTAGAVILIVGYVLVAEYSTSFARLAGVLKVLVGSTVIVNLAAMVSLLTPLEIPLMNQMSYGRLAGGLVDPNAWGGLLTVCLGAHLVLRSHETLWFARWADWPIIVSLTAGLVLTTSRSAWIALLAMVVAWTFSKRSMLAPALLAVAVVATVALAAVGNGTSQRLVELSTRSDTVSSRMELNVVAVDSLFEYPFGLGLGVFSERYGGIVHNTPLWFAADLGLGGLIVFMGFSFWMLSRYLVARRRHPEPDGSVVLAIGLGLLAMFVLGLSIEAFYQRHWWVLMALLAAASAIPATPAPVAQQGQG